MDFRMIRRKLALLKERDVDLVIHGSESHQYRIRPRLPKREIWAFERLLKIRLAEDYRSFLAAVGNGGAGPAYGLLSLGNCGDYDILDLASPFPHVDLWNPAPEFYAKHPEPYDGNFLSEEYQKFGEDYSSPRQIQGSMPICHEGCGYYYLLVVSGPERGHIWLDGRASDGGIAPLQSKTGGRFTFLECYEDWLDESLAQLKIDPTNLR